MLSALTPYFNNNEALLTSMLAYIVHDTFAGEGEEEINEATSTARERTCPRFARPIKIIRYAIDITYSFERH